MGFQHEGRTAGPRVDFPAACPLLEPRRRRQGVDVGHLKLACLEEAYLLEHLHPGTQNPGWIEIGLVVSSWDSASSVEVLGQGLRQTAFVPEAARWLLRGFAAHSRSGQAAVWRQVPGSRIFQAWMG